MVVCVVLVILMFRLIEVLLISCSGFSGMFIILVVFLISVGLMFLVIMWMFLLIQGMMQWLVQKKCVLLIMMGVLWIWCMKFSVLVIVMGLVCLFLMILISSILLMGEKKWMLMNCLGWLLVWVRLLIGRVEVLVVKIVFLGIMVLVLVVILVLIFGFLNMVFMIRLQFFSVV